MTREEKLQKAHQMFDNRNLLTELKWQKEYFKRGYVSNQEELFNLWIFDECIKALEQEPCEDAISRKAVLDAIDGKAWEFCDYLISKGRNDEQKPVSHFADNLRECVREELPSVTPQSKTGRWMPSHIPESILDECSECGFSCGSFSFTYCPNCGAKMVEPHGSEEKDGT